MMEKPSKRILQLPIKTLALSEELKSAAKYNRILTLEQLLSYKRTTLRKLRGFDVQVVHEYVSFLEERGLGYLVDLQKT